MKVAVTVAVVGCPHPTCFLLRVRGRISEFARRLLNSGQESLEDGGVVLRLTVSGEGDLLRWILGYGSHVEVLEPEWLRERVAAELARAAEAYRG